MTEFLAFTITGIVTGSVYAIAASGLVVTYTTSGIFNFAHGAIGMVMAFLYWQLRVQMHWPAPIALIVVLFILSPLLGAVIERVMMRRLYAAPMRVAIVTRPNSRTGNRRWRREAQWLMASTLPTPAAT